MPDWTYRLLFSPHGRISRAWYAVGWCASWIVSLAAASCILGLASSLGAPLTTPQATIFGHHLPLAITPTVLAALVVTVVPLALYTTFCLDSKRLHDIDQTAWWFGAAFFVPGGNSILTIVLMMYPGQRGQDNRFGPDPVAPRDPIQASDPAFNPFIPA